MIHMPPLARYETKLQDGMMRSMRQHTRIRQIMIGWIETFDLQLLETIMNFHWNENY